jgi:acetylornithine deacetylase/succinyl-diaminopimelate desuccinylase-like protein
MVGVAERGVMTVLLTARENGGHASTPPAMPATVRLARAIDRLHRHPFHAHRAPVRALFATIARTRLSRCGCSRTSLSRGRSSHGCSRTWAPR